MNFVKILQFVKYDLLSVLLNLFNF